MNLKSDLEKPLFFLCTTISSKLSTNIKTTLLATNSHPSMVFQIEEGKNVIDSVYPKLGLSLGFVNLQTK